MDKEHVFFENYADTWDRDRKEDPRTLRRLLDLAQIERGAAVLDVGCGTGVLIPYLQECIGEEGTITALDYSRQMLDKAREKFGRAGNVSFIEGDILKCHLPEQAYDVVMCLNVYPHISRRNRDFIRQVRASLRDGGSFVIMHDMGRKRVNSIHDGGKEQRLPLLPPVDVLEAMLIGAGFTVVAALDTDECYFVKVVKAQELPYIHYHDGDEGDESGAVAAAGHGHRHSHKEQKVVLNRLARISGHPLFKRVSIFHALNQKAIARIYAKEVGKKYEDLNLIIAHLGGGISVGAHDHGRVIDVNNALDGDGPFSPERSGSLPTGQLVKLCFSGTKTEAEIKKIIKGAGGLVGHLGTNDAYEVELKAKEDPKYKLIQDAMSYQVGKSIGAMAAVLKGKVDAILLTGGIAKNPFLVDYVKDMVEFIAPVKVYPGEDEMRALAMNGLMVIRGELKAKIYK